MEQWKEVFVDKLIDNVMQSILYLPAQLNILFVPFIEIGAIQRIAFLL